ncbi:RteC domain-containing protein [Pedobacter fastidiosus]|uniref:RteC domain-containing protein n=1 Tax=Pedobacter fastidiosus TaxID=2765361 RepID=A0ABR7KYP2_9SPHI|nr:RteC domain-containing protein [Pedobacter fastidiosus]MBC6112808.1 RteC domain-containing protein [Pedobacter fastidiosus]
MIQELSSRLLKQLEPELEEISFQALSPIKRLTTAMKPIRQALKKLKSYIDDHPFASPEEEIRFFKYIKPDFYQWQIYFNELYTIEENIPFADADAQRLHFENELIYVQRFFREYNFQYQYYKRDASELDNLYFIRGADNGSPLVPNVPELDASFSTNSDYLFSKIKAFEMLREWLSERINHLKKNPLASYQPGSDSDGIRWTGESINLAELAFGIHRTGQVNNGTASIGAIFRWLEDRFQVSIGIPSKRLSEIRRRTSISRTRYLDEMIEMVIQKLDKEDEYTPDKNGRK